MTIQTRALALPRIDHKGLEALVRGVEEDGEAYELRTRSELMLMESEASYAALSAEQGEVRAEITKMEGYVERLGKVLGKLRTAEADVGVRLNVALQSATLLKQSGVSVPAAPKEGEAQ